MKLNSLLSTDSTTTSPQSADSASAPSPINGESQTPQSDESYSQFDQMRMTKPADPKLSFADAPLHSLIEKNPDAMTKEELDQFVATLQLLRKQPQALGAKIKAETDHNDAQAGQVGMPRRRSSKGAGVKRVQINALNFLNP